MDLQAAFKNYLQKELGISVGDKILLTVSGGRDSMLMAYLFSELGYDCVIAHCNFQLRGQESDLDEELVRSFALQRQIPLYVERFYTKAYAEEKHVSIQMAARTLRYTWFEELRNRVGARWIAVAQHRNDHIETVLLNLTRGTGLQGLQGILPKRGSLIRPLLFLASREITHYVEQLQIPYRDDQSNFSTKYARNKIRLEIVPKFREIVSDFDAIMVANIQHFQEAYALLQSFVEPIKERLFGATNNGQVKIEKKELGQYIDNMPLLFELFKPYGFSKGVLGDLQGCWNGEPGKRFQSDSYELLLDRDDLRLIEKTSLKTADQEVEIMRDSRYVQFDEFHFDVAIAENIVIQKDRQVAQLDFDKLSFPLHLRFWQEGDYFYPLGMQGKKKLSDFFIQEKIAREDKKHIPLLLDNRGEIVWVVNHRLDNRYKITESTKKVFTLVCK